MFAQWNERRCLRRRRTAGPDLRFLSPARPQFTSTNGGQGARRDGCASNQLCLLDEVEAVLTVVGKMRFLLGSGAPENRPFVVQLRKGLSPSLAIMAASRAWIASLASAGEWRECRARTRALQCSLTGAPLPAPEFPSRSGPNGTGEPRHARGGGAAGVCPAHSRRLPEHRGGTAALPNGGCARYRQTKLVA